MFLGIEIGGTKLQLGVGTGRGGPLVALQRAQVQRSRGALGIRETIVEMARPLVQQYDVQRVGLGFGGPVDASAGNVLLSFQISGWDGFPLTQWCRETLLLPSVLENDSNLAGLGEARFGAGKGAHVVVYSNVGSGIGGALVIDGKLYLGGAKAAVAEIGHLRPGPQAEKPEQTVESVASGWGIADQARTEIERLSAGSTAPTTSMYDQVNGDLTRLTGKIVADAAADGDPIAKRVLNNAMQTYGWALAQAITLVAPNIVVVGGGVSQLGESMFFEPLREFVEQYVMPPLRQTYEIRPAALGEEVVVHGALALAADSHSDRS
jgi:glucokinase